MYILSSIYSSLGFTWSASKQFPFLSWNYSREREGDLAVMALVEQTAQAALLSATSNLIAQAMSAYQEHRPFSLDIAALFRYVAFGILNTPPNILWQGFLESQFPSGSNSSRGTKDHPKRSDEKTANTNRSSARNIAIKFALDQTVGAVMNVLLFVVISNAMNGAGADQIVTAIQRVSLMCCPLA